jgi:hypothetical protein
MAKYGGETSVPSDQELIFWGWKANQISQLRTLTPTSQQEVFTEYIRRIMEEVDSNDTDF